MTSHERGVEEASRVFRGETLTVAKLMHDYGISRAAAKRDMWVLRQAFKVEPPPRGTASVVGARLPA